MSLFAGTWDGWWCDPEDAAIFGTTTLTVSDDGDGNLTASFVPPSQVGKTFNGSSASAAPANGEVFSGQVSQYLFSFMVVAAARDIMSGSLQLPNNPLLFVAKRQPS